MRKDVDLRAYKDKRHWDIALLQTVELRGDGGQGQRLHKNPTDINGPDLQESPGV